MEVEQVAILRGTGGRHSGPSWNNLRFYLEMLLVPGEEEVLIVEAFIVQT